MAKIKESALLKSLADLEEGVMKGDPLQNQDPEGGFSTEGKPLSSEGKGTKKSEADSSSSSSVDKADKGDDDSDDESSDDTPPPKDDDSDDESSDDGEDTAKCGKTRKSLREIADTDETLKKGFEVSEFLEQLTNRTSEALDGLRAEVLTRIAKSEGGQHDFNTRLAKAVVQMGKQVNELTEVVKSFAQQPNVPQRRSVLSKAEVPSAPLGGGQDTELAGLNRDKMVEWLVRKAEAGEINAMEITVFEQAGYNPAALSPHIRKALANDLAK